VNRYFMMMLAATLAGSVLSAQNGNPLATEVKGSYTGVKNNLIKAAEKMPEENYSFKPTPEVQTFAVRVAHIADANARTCGAIKGEQKQLGAASKTSKADLVAALKESFEYCDAVFDGASDADLSKMVKVGQRERSEGAILWGVVTHSNEIYGTMGVYMRLKGIVPPSSEPRN
jgi:uncharacterized damage-inducible protein DinB